MDIRFNKRIAQLFSTPSDGSLPEITAIFSSKASQRRAIHRILSNAIISDKSTIFLDNENILASSLRVFDLATKLNVGHHILFFLGKDMPEIGLSVFKLGLSFDIRTGVEWSSESVGVFIGLLEDIALSKGCKKLSLDEEGEYFSSTERSLFDDYFINLKPLG